MEVSGQFHASASLSLWKESPRPHHLPLEKTGKTPDPLSLQWLRREEFQRLCLELNLGPPIRSGSHYTTVSHQIWNALALTRVKQQEFL